MHYITMGWSSLCQWYKNRWAHLRVTVAFSMVKCRIIHARVDDLVVFSIYAAYNRNYISNSSYNKAYKSDNACIICRYVGII